MLEHFAEVKDGVVVNVVQAEQSFIDQQSGQWVKACYRLHGNELPVGEDGPKFRKNYPSVGYLYNSELDIFTDVKPFPSWILDESGLWTSPVPCPEDTEKSYKWNEATVSWVEVTL
jgi:hypothetical protein